MYHMVLLCDFKYAALFDIAENRLRIIHDILVDMDYCVDWMERGSEDEKDCLRTLDEIYRIYGHLISERTKQNHAEWIEMNELKIPPPKEVKRQVIVIDDDEEAEIKQEDSLSEEIGPNSDPIDDEGYLPILRTAPQRGPIRLDLDESEEDEIYVALEVLVPVTPPVPNPLHGAHVVPPAPKSLQRINDNLELEGSYWNSEGRRKTINSRVAKQ
jgi:hypothetical protein